MENNWNAYGYTMIVVFVSIALLIGAYFAVNLLGLATQTLDARVVDKEHTPPGKTYSTTIIDGRSVVRQHETGDVYGVVLETAEGTALALLPEARFESLNVGDRVKVSASRTRITGRLQVHDVLR